MKLAPVKQDGAWQVKAIAETESNPNGNSLAKQEDTDSGSPHDSCTLVSVKASVSSLQLALKGSQCFVYHFYGKTSWKVLKWTDSLFPILRSQKLKLQHVKCLRPGDSRQRSHTGRQHDSFGRRGRFAGARAWRFSVWSIQDGRARLVPSLQGKQQLEVLRTESFTASTANPGRFPSVGDGHPPKETKKQKNFITRQREIQDGHIAAAQDCSSQ
ncbi:hypothetical protein AAY473_028949 [Plecturocebus cupreus]